VTELQPEPKKHKVRSTDSAHFCSFRRL